MFRTRSHWLLSVYEKHQNWEHKCFQHLLTTLVSGRNSRSTSINEAASFSRSLFPFRLTAREQDTPQKQGSTDWGKHITKMIKTLHHWNPTPFPFRMTKSSLWRKQDFSEIKLKHRGCLVDRHLSFPAECNSTFKNSVSYTAWYRRGLKTKYY